MEKGFFTKAQLGFALRWGDAEGANRLLEMISHRKGFGDLLAEGMKVAAAKLGGAAQDASIYTVKGASPRGHDHRARWDEMLDTCTASTGTLDSGIHVHVPAVRLAARITPFKG